MAGDHSSCAVVLRSRCTSRRQRSVGRSPPPLPFPWTLSLHRRWCPSASHRPVSFLSLLGLSVPLYFPFLSLGGCANGAPGLSLFHCSVSRPHVLKRAAPIGLSPLPLALSLNPGESMPLARAMGGVVSVKFWDFGVALAEGVQISNTGTGNNRAPKGSARGLLSPGPNSSVGCVQHTAKVGDLQGDRVAALLALRRQRCREGHRGPRLCFDSWRYLCLAARLWSRAVQELTEVRKLVHAAETLGVRQVFQGVLRLFELRKPPLLLRDLPFQLTAKQTTCRCTLPRPSRGGGRGVTHTRQNMDQDTVALVRPWSNRWLVGPPRHDQRSGAKESGRNARLQREEKLRNTNGGGEITPENKTGLVPQETVVTGDRRRKKKPCVPENWPQLLALTASHFD